MTLPYDVKRPGIGTPDRGVFDGACFLTKEQTRLLII